MANNTPSPLGALERSILGTPNAMANLGLGEGEIEPDDSPDGRTAVQYGGGDGLFSPDAPSAGGLDAIGAGLMGVLGDPSALDGGAAGASALIANLEAMAADFERQSGEPETEIRAQIAQLRTVLAARPAAVAFLSITSASRYHSGGSVPT